MFIIEQIAGTTETNLGELTAIGVKHPAEIKKQVPAKS
jgi:hypothetical protein